MLLFSLRATESGVDLQLLADVRRRSAYLLRLQGADLRLQVPYRSELGSDGRLQLTDSAHPRGRVDVVDRRLVPTSVATT
ncbi:MAG: hypothetical protein ACR2JU_06190 [Nocardioidaceae bacterium]